MTETSRISDQLRQIREEAGLSVRMLAARLGIPASTYANYETRFKKPFLPMEFVLELTEVLSGSQVPKSKIMALAGVDTTPASEHREKLPSGTKLIPVYDVAASAGNGSVVEYEPIIEQLSFPGDYLRKLTKAHPRFLKIISVKGDSMEPTLKDDDIVMLDASKTNLSYDGMFVLRFDGTLHVKRVSRSSGMGERRNPR